MARISDILTGDTDKLNQQTNQQRQIERMNMIRKIKQGRKLVGTADSISGVKFVSQGLTDAKSFKNKDGQYEVWASFGFITCEFDLTTAEMRVGLAYGRFDMVNITERQGENGVIIYEVWGIL